MQEDSFQLTPKIENTKDLPQVGDREEISIPHCRGCDDQKPDIVSKPEGSFFSGIFIVMEWISLVLQEEEKPSRPTYEAKYVGQKLKVK